MATKLTEKQAEILDVLANNYDLAGVALSNYHVTYSVPNALVEKGYARKVTHNGAIYYEITDAGRAAIAQPVSVATDAAPAWSPAVGDSVREKETQRIGEVVDIDSRPWPYVVQFENDGDPVYLSLDELDPAPDAARTVADLPPFARTETDYANAMKLIDQQAAKIEALEAFYNLARTLGVTWDMWELVSHRDDNSFIDANGILHRLHEAGYEIDDPYIHNPDAPREPTRPEQIATLTRERDAACAAAGMPKYRIGQVVSVSDWSSSVGTIEEIRISNDGIEYRVYVEGESMAYTWAEGKVTPTEDTDAALVAARQRADDGTRLTTADVRAQSEFAEED